MASLLMQLGETLRKTNALIDNLEADLRECQDGRRDFEWQLFGRPCPRCDGGGTIMVLRPGAAHPGNPDGESNKDCPACRATGRVGGAVAALERLRHLVYAPGGMTIEEINHEARQIIDDALAELRNLGRED